MTTFEGLHKKLAFFMNLFTRARFFVPRSFFNFDESLNPVCVLDLGVDEKYPPPRNVTFVTLARGWGTFE